MGKTERTLLALAFEGALGSENLLGEVLGGVALGRGEARIRNRCSCGMGTLRTELGPDRKRASTVRASPCQRASALFTELRPGTILVLTPGTFHTKPPESGPIKLGRA